MKVIIGHMTVPEAQSIIMKKLDEMAFSINHLEKQLKKLHDAVIAQRMEDDGK